MDVAGDSQIDMEDTFTKTRYKENGYRLGKDEIEAEVNAKFKADAEKQAILTAKLPPDYCGPCYGAVEEGEEGKKCCQTCDELIDAYKAKRWAYDGLIPAAEQCVREGVHAKKPKVMKKGEGCNLSGFMMVNRVNGNFHIAMGEGVERDGRHIQLFNPEDTMNFNASHVIHELSFGEEGQKDNKEGRSVLDGVQKIVTEKSGGTGLFHYFVKVVPTVYKDREGPDRESNRFFFTERFRPLFTDLEEEHIDHGEKRRYHDHVNEPKDSLDEHDYYYYNTDDFSRDIDDDDYDYDRDDDEEGSAEANTENNFGKLPKTAEKKQKDEEKQKKREDKEKGKKEKKENEEEKGKNDKQHAGVKMGHSRGGNHGTKDHHKVQNAVLPGVFFIYEVYPFAVEISTNSVPLTHLIVRFMAVIGGAVTITGLLDKFLYARDLNKKGSGGGSFR